MFSIVKVNENILKGDVVTWDETSQSFVIGVVVVDGSVNAVHNAGLPRFSYNVFKH